MAVETIKEVETINKIEKVPSAPHANEAHRGRSIVDMCNELQGVMWQLIHDPKSLVRRKILAPGEIDKLSKEEKEAYLNGASDAELLAIKKRQRNGSTSVDLSGENLKELNGHN